MEVLLVDEQYLSIVEWLMLSYHLLKLLEEEDWKNDDEERLLCCCISMEELVRTVVIV